MQTRMRRVMMMCLAIVSMAFTCVSMSWAATITGTDPKGDPIQPVGATISRSVCPPTESGYGSPGGVALIQVRIGPAQRFGYGHWSQLYGCGGISATMTLDQPERAEFFLGSDRPHGSGDLYVDPLCEIPGTNNTISWPRQRTIAHDPNMPNGFVQHWVSNYNPLPTWPSNLLTLAAWASPAHLYHFDWGELRPAPDSDITLTEKPYLKPIPVTPGSVPANPDTIFLYRADLIIESDGSTLEDCNGYFPGWEGRGDLLLTRLRPGRFTRPGFTPPTNNPDQSPPIDIRMSNLNPWDESVMTGLPAFFEPPSADAPAAGSHVRSAPDDRSIAQVTLDPLYEPRRVPYRLIGAGFGFPLVAGKLHTIHADLCVMDGDTCQSVPEASRGPEGGVSSETVPVYAIPVPEPDEDPWIDLSATWWGKLTLEEQGALTGDATGKEMPHPKGILSSMNESDTLEYLRQHVTWTLTQPANHTELLDQDEPTIATEPFSRVVPHARLNVAEPGLYEVEFAVKGEEGDRLVVDKARLIPLDLDAYWPGTLAEPGPIVSDGDENDPLNLFMAVNDDDDNFDNIVDNNMDTDTGSPTVDPEDDELVTVIIRKFVPPVAGVGTLELTGSEGLRLFSADGTQVVALPLSLDFAHPDPDSPLINITTHSVTFVAEATAIADDATLTLRYLSHEEEIARDEVHLTIVDPEITGGFTRGSIRYTKARKAAGHWIVVGELTPERPLSVLVPNVLNAFTATAAMQYGCTQDPNEQPLTVQDGSLMNERYFQIQAMLYNTLIAPINLILQLLGRPLLEEYSAEKVAAWLSQQSGIAQPDLLAGKYFVTSAFTDPKSCQIKFFSDPGNPKSFNSQQLYVDRVDLDIQHGGQNAAEVPDSDEELRGALTLANPAMPKNNAVMKLVLRKPAFADQLKLEEQDQQVRLTVVPGTITLWDTPTKAMQLEPVDGQYEFSLGERDKTVWIEAPEVSQTEREIRIDLEWLDATDTVRATACWGDLDIDSDNDAAIMHSPEEDALEDNPAQPGKILVVNTWDQDGDSIPNFADGMLTGQFDTRSTPAGGQFTPVVLELLPEGVDWQNARIRFHYDASNPEAMTVDDQGTPDDPTDDTFTLPDTGHLRIWTKDGNLARQTTTDYLASDVAYPLANLPVEEGRFIRLYLEGVKASPTAVDLRRIRVDFDLTGTGQFVEDVDAVRFTVVAVTDMTIYRPESADFTEPLEWGEVIFRDEPVCVAVTLSAAIPSLYVLPDGLLELRVFSDISDNTWMPLTFNQHNTATLEQVNGVSQIRLTFTWENLIELGKVTENATNDGVVEFTSADWIENDGDSNHNDSNEFDTYMIAQGNTGRGKARGIKGSYNGNETLLIIPMNKDFGKAAGVQFLQFHAPGATYSGQGEYYYHGEPRMIQNQAEYFYYSGHGGHSTAKLSSLEGFTPEEAKPYWNHEIQTVIFAGCSVLDIKDYHRQWREYYDENDYEKWESSPGERWLQTGPKLLLGYAFKSPVDVARKGGLSFEKDERVTAKIVERWFKYMKEGRANGEPMDKIMAWMYAVYDMMDANGNPHFRRMNACAIDQETMRYYYWQKTINPDNKISYVIDTIRFVNGGWPVSFIITQDVLEGLKQKGMPDEILEQLQSLQDQAFTDKVQFLDAVQQKIGQEKTEQYEDLLVKYTQGAPLD